tara:strand:- start:277 stop:453 length:177 start_codon:yes stop_codon:yes gene_type:complete
LIYFLLLVKADANNPAGTETIPIPINNITEENIFPTEVIGTISPYPAVVKVVTDHQKL